MDNEFSTSFLDLLLCSLGCMIGLFALALIQMNPIKEDKGVERKAEFLIITEWPSDSNDDVDGHLQDPNGSHCWYQSREPGLMHLDRDDRGISHDTDASKDGEIVTFPENTETFSIRAIMPGEYTFNLHMFTKRDPADTEVSVKVLKLNPKVKTIRSEKIVLQKNGQEETVFRFTMDAEGNLHDWHKLKKHLATNGGYAEPDYKEFYE